FGLSEAGDVAEVAAVEEEAVAAGDEGAGAAHGGGRAHGATSPLSVSWRSASCASSSGRPAAPGAVALRAAAREGRGRPLSRRGFAPAHWNRVAVFSLRR